MVIVPIVRASPTPEAERIERRDKAAFWLGMTLAVIVGLNAEYFGTGSETLIVLVIVHGIVENWRRFAKSTCPVRTHHVSFVLNDLARCQLR
jgi:hypothetical protein